MIYFILGWFDTTVKEDESLFFSQIKDNDSNLQVKNHALILTVINYNLHGQIHLTIKISNNFSYILKTMGNVIGLKDIRVPNKIISVSSLLETITLINSSSFCCGNEDSRFFPLQAERHGKFNDASGIIILANCMINFSCKLFSIVGRFNDCYV